MDRSLLPEGMKMHIPNFEGPKLEKPGNEARLVQEAKKRGGIAYKMPHGLPDRLVILPDRDPFFVEVKRPGGKLSRRQEQNHMFLRSLGMPVWVVSTDDEIDRVLS